MKDNEQSRFMKWGVPGWIMILTFMSFIFLDILFSPSSSTNSLVAVIKTIMHGFSVNITAAAAASLIVAAAGIPLGFLIYQAYFYIRWNSPFARDGLFPPLIVGRRVDLDRTMDGIDPNDFIGLDEWRKKWKEDDHFEADHGVKWRYIENFFTEIVQYMDSKLGGFSLYTRYRYLMDLMHTLGASLFGVYLGFLGYLLLKVKTDDVSITIVSILSLVPLAILLWLLELEDKAKRDAVEISTDVASTDEPFRYIAVKPFETRPNIQYFNPSAIYLLFLFIVLYLGSPSPYTSIYSLNQLIARFFVSGCIGCVWLYSKREYPTKVFKTEFATFIIFLTGALAGSQLIRITINPDWWNIGWALLFFLVVNMIFVKNRQNTRDDLIAMQNYTMKRYFANSIKPFSPPKITKSKRLTPKMKKPKKRKKKENKAFQHMASRRVK